MLISALDPGETTGICYMDLGPLEKRPRIVVKQFPTNSPQQYLRLTQELATTYVDYVGDKVLIYERFNFRHEERTRDKIIYTSVEVIGAVKHWWAEEELEYPGAIKLEAQMAAEGKGFWTDDKIKKVGLWTGSLPHGMDALRHALHYVTFALKDHRYLYVLKSPTTHTLVAPYDGTLGRIEPL